MRQLRAQKETSIAANFLIPSGIPATSRWIFQRRCYALVPYNPVALHSISWWCRHGASHRRNFETPPLTGSCLGSFGTKCVCSDGKELTGMWELVSFPSRHIKGLLTMG